jgi:ADP-ribose pyrophosphatase YjhB (NUDIX family)
MGEADRAQGTLVETSAGGVVVRTIDGTPHALVIRDPYKKWGLPKGHTEDGESSQETALREVGEETGLRDLELGQELVTIDWFFHVRGRRIHKFTTFYLMYSTDGEPTPEEGEGISACEWVPLAIAHERISYDNARGVVKAAQRALREPDVGEAAD